ncbi:MAG: ferrochelatase [Actinomycetia bacterium]|nr:ferrochelatase [Actinomycetes bacterium]
MIDTQPVGVLLLQLGTPDSPSTRDVRRYLNEFLSDPRVMDVPAPVRWLLLNTVILPFRPRKSAEAYKKIWMDDGSPLLIHTEALVSQVQSKLGDDYIVEFGMRYGSPTIDGALERLIARDVSDIRVLPLFPQYASSAGGSATARTMEILTDRWNIPSVSFLPEFYDEPGYIAAIVETAGPRLEAFQPDHILFSYHGLPERQVKKADATGIHCLASDGCCDAIGPVNRHCYRAQCFATTRLVAAGLDLSPDEFSTAFQSRLAGTPWITPQTDRVLQGLHDAGIRQIAVFTNSFVSDCLETLEEIGIRLRHQWVELGGEDLLLIPCVNEAPTWVDSVVSMVSKGDSS